MNLRQLEVFRTVMRSGTITSAARSLNISQPAVSKIIHQAERQLGIKLFRRERGGLRPTIEAETLYHEAKRLFVELDALKHLSDDLRNGVTGVLRVGASASLALTVSAHAINEFRAAYPGVKILTHLGSAAELSELMRLQQIDIAVSLSAMDVPGATTNVLSQVEIVCMMHERHPLARSEGLRPRDLEGYPLVSFNSASHIGSLLDSAFRESNMVRKVDIEVDLSLSACALIQQGLSIALVDGFVPMLGFPTLISRPFFPRNWLDVLMIEAPSVSRFTAPFIPYIHRALQTIQQNRHKGLGQSLPA